MLEKKFITSSVTCTPKTLRNIERHSRRPAVENKIGIFIYLFSVLEVTQQAKTKGGCETKCLTVIVHIEENRSSASQDFQYSSLWKHDSFKV